VALACTDSRSTQHWSLATLRGICSNPQHRAMAVKQGILDPLVLMARTDSERWPTEFSLLFWHYYFLGIKKGNAMLL